MTPTYLLPCHGENHVEVTTAEAGRIVPCPCGKEVTVPTFREIQQLPRKHAFVDQTPTWSTQQGACFSIGLVLFAGAAIVAGLLFYQRSQLNTEEVVIPESYLVAFDKQIMELDAEKTLDGWNNFLGHPLPEERVEVPQFELDRAAARGIMWKLIAAGAVAVVGLGLMFGSALFKPRPVSAKGRPKKPQPA